MKLDESFERALRSPEPMNSLRSLAQELLSQGKEKNVVLAAFENVRQVLREAGREGEEDAVTDVMDFLVGWCSPHMKLDATGEEDATNGPTLLRESGRQMQPAPAKQERT